MILEDVRNCLLGLGFKIGEIITVYDKYYNKNYKVYKIFLNGKSNLENWIKIIGTNNPKHRTKYDFWKKFGYYTPYMNISERIKRLKS